MKNRTIFTILGFFTILILLETVANGCQQNEKTKNTTFTDNKTTTDMKTATIAHIILEITGKGRPRTQQDYDSLTEYGKTFDLYCEPSYQPLTKYTRCFFYEKEKNENKDRFKDLQLACSGDRFIEVLAHIFKQVEQIDVDKFVYELNMYHNNNVPLSLHKATLDDVILMFSTYGMPTKEELMDFAETVDLYRKPSKDPLTTETIIFLVEKNTEESVNQHELKDLELACTGKQFIDVFLKNIERGESTSTRQFVEELNFYLEHNTFMDMKQQIIPTIFALPEPIKLLQRSKALATLDAIYCQQWDMRYFSHNSHWGENEQMASMRDGTGNDYFILFAPFGTAIKGCSTENGCFENNEIANQARSKMPLTFAKFLNEPAFSIQNASFIAWFDEKWHKIENMPPQKTQPDSDFLTQWLRKDETFFKGWMDSYYEIDIKLEFIEHIFQFKPINKQFIEQLGVDLDKKLLKEDLDEIGYPYTDF